MLSYFYDHGLIRYSDKEIDTWQEAIEESCQILLDKKLIDESYVQEIIECVEKYGPYIVIVPGVAVPHSSEKSKGVYGTAISFTKMKNPIKFDSKTGKQAMLFFTLAAKNPEEHMANIQNLSELLMTEGLIEDLERSNNLGDYKKVMDKYQRSGV